MKINKFFGLSILAVTSTALLASCGPKKSSATLLSSLGNSTGIGGGSGGSLPPVDQWKNVDVDGYVDMGVAGGKHQIIRIDKVAKTVILSAPLPANPLGGIGKIDLVELPGAYVEIGPDANGDTELRIVVPMQYFAKGVEIADPKALPNGRPLPTVPGGELPRIAVHITNSNGELYLYLSSTVFAVYVPVPGFNPFIQYEWPVKNRDKSKILGYVAVVPAVKPHTGGIFSSFMIPLELARVIDDLF